MQTRYKKVAGSVCGFPKFVTSGSGLGSGFSKIQFWVWVRVQGSKISQKSGFWVQVWHYWQGVLAKTYLIDYLRLTFYYF
jgi:hypothetical protein